MEAHVHPLVFVNVLRDSQESCVLKVAISYFAYAQLELTVLINAHSNL